MTRSALSLGAALLLLSTAFPVVAADQDPQEAQKAFIERGEAVVHALGDKVLMVAFDEAGHGDMTWQFRTWTKLPLPADLELRSKDARFEQRKDAIYVVLPHERRVLVFPYPDDEGPLSAPDPAWKGLEITRIGGMSGFSETCSTLDEHCKNGPIGRVHLTLDDVEAGRLPPSWKAVARDLGSE